LNNTAIYLDFETAGLPIFKDGKTILPQPVQLAAVAIDLNTLTFTKNDVFSSYMRPIFDDDEALKFGVGPIQDKALQINHTNREMLAKAPETKVAWSKFVEFVKRYSKGNGPYTRPIAAGFNTIYFDMPIIDNLAAGCYNFGPGKDGKNTLFHVRDHFDAQKLLPMLIGHFPDLTSFSMDTMRTLLGFKDTGRSHDARIDVIEGAALLCRILQFFRKVATPSKFTGSFKDFRIEDYLE
jgi:DNA polymerase III epsilon subunit-like protein